MAGLIAKVCVERSPCATGRYFAWAAREALDGVRLPISGVEGASAGRVGDLGVGSPQTLSFGAAERRLSGRSTGSPLSNSAGSCLLGAEEWAPGFGWADEFGG
jgi:hypothetical protein